MLVKKTKHIGFCTYRRSYLIWCPVIKQLLYRALTAYRWEEHAELQKSKGCLPVCRTSGEYRYRTEPKISEIRNRYALPNLEKKRLRCRHIYRYTEIQEISEYGNSVFVLPLSACARVTPPRLSNSCDSYVITAGYSLRSQ